MTVAFSQLLPAFQGSAPASSDPFTPGAAGNTGIYFDFTGDGPDQNLQMTGTGSWPSQAQFNTSSSATFAMQANIAMSGASQTVSLTDTAAGFVAAIIGVEYSGVAAMSGAVITEIDAPGTGPGAILGASVAVPAGAILVAVCVDPINSETITGVGGTSRGSSVFNPSYRVQEYAGTGADVQPSFTTSANGSAIYYVYQLLLSPPMASSLKYVSSPLAVKLQSYYSAASSGFTTYGPAGDGTQPPGTAYVQEVTLQASPWNVVDVNATSWIASWITAFAADPLLSKIALNASILPPPGSVPGTVVPPVLSPPSSIVVTPANATLSKGSTQQFTAIGVYASGNIDLTLSATWASSATSKATIGAHGLATGVAVGPTTISATFDGVAGSTVLTVGAAALVSIAVTPPTATKAPLATQQYTATGTYTDSSTQNLTSTATWASDNHAFATIAAGGLATAVADGVAHITAQSGAITSPAVALTVAG